jgi:pre-mRNA 3'-end-processing factor FIP1
MYRQRQQTVTGNLAQQKAETAQLQQMFSTMGPGGMNPGAAAPTGPAAGGGGGPANMPMAPGGMNEEMMAQAFQQMMSQGIDPSTMDFGAFMSMAGGGAMPGFGAPAGPQGGFGGGGGGANQGGGGGGGGGRRGGRGRGGNW